MSDSNIRWKRSVAGKRNGYILERFSHHHGTGPIWVPVTMQDEEGNDTSSTLFVGDGSYTEIPNMMMGPEPATVFEVALDSVEDFEDRPGYEDLVKGFQEDPDNG